MRIRLAVAWGGFLLLWCGLVSVIVGPITFLACSSENLELEDGSPRESYCEGVRDFLSSGEPSELTTPLPYLLVLTVVAAGGAYGVWRRSTRLVRQAAAVSLAALVGHVMLAVLLPA